MNNAEMNKRFKEFYKKADYKTKLRINREIHQIIIRNQNKKQRKAAFFEAVEQGNLNAVETILERDKIIDVNQKDDELGRTPLLYAVINGNSDLIRLLLQHGADPRIKNDKGYDAIDAANHTGNEEIMKLLTLD